MRDASFVSVRDESRVSMRHESAVTAPCGLPSRPDVLCPLAYKRDGQQLRDSGQQLEGFSKPRFADDSPTFEIPPARLASGRQAVFVEATSIGETAAGIRFDVVGRDGTKRPAKLVRHVRRMWVRSQEPQVIPCAIGRKEGQPVSSTMPERVGRYLERHRLDPREKFFLERHALKMPDSEIDRASFKCRTHHKALAASCVTRAHS